jgi:hypothetical protein
MAMNNVCKLNVWRRAMKLPRVLEKFDYS